MMSIRFVRQAVGFSLMTLLVSSLVQAQPPGGGRGFGGGGFGGRGGFNIDLATLLRADQVRKELKIEETQAATIDAALEAYREERNSSPRPDRDAFRKMSEEEQSAYFDKSRKEGEELSNKTDEVLSALLEPEQTKRLDQISLQAKLYTAAVPTLKGDNLKSKLSLTEEQVAKLDEAEKTATADMQKMSEEMRASFQGGDGKQGGGGFEQMQEKMQAARKKSTDAAMAVLTDDQKKTIDELTGVKFEIDPRALMGGRGDRGRGGNGGGGRRNRPPAE